MAKTIFSCQKCGYQSLKWQGRCPDCGSWNSFSEEVLEDNKINVTHSKSAEVLELSKLDADEYFRFKTGLSEFDRVLGGGIVPASVVLIGGEPGIGKSTLLLQLAANLSKEKKILYVAGEESPNQVKLRADRLNINKNILILPEISLEGILCRLDEVNPEIVILDSIQTLKADRLSSPPGTVSQIKECTQLLIQYAKSKNITFFIVGHVTKEGVIAGPRLLEHMVDTVIYFEGERKFNFRLLRTVKNRFGSTNEVGIFEMSSNGLMEVLNPAELFLSDNTNNKCGIHVSASMEGTRPILVEIEALTSYSSYGNGRRLTQGLDLNRMIMIIAVLQKFIGLRLSEHDAYVNIVGGMKVSDPALDLACAMAIFSSVKNKAPSYLFSIGELSLTSEIRPVPFLNERIKEAAKLGYKKMIIPKIRKNHTLPKLKGYELVQASSLEEAIEIAF